MNTPRKVTKKKGPSGDLTGVATGVGDVTLLGDESNGDDRVALVRLLHGQAVFVPEGIRRRLSSNALRLAARIQHAAIDRERLMGEIDALVPELRRAGASWSAVGYFTNMTAAGAMKRWGGDDGER